MFRTLLVRFGLLVDS